MTVILHVSLLFWRCTQPGRLNPKYEIESKKKMAGAAFFLTQPVYSKEDIERIDRIRNETGAWSCAE